MMKSTIQRRHFLAHTAGAAAAVSLAGRLAADDKPAAKMRLGLVTYLWGKDWDLSTLIANCEKSRVLGVELRTTHRHGVEPSLNAGQRAEVKKRFADSPVTLLGPGSNERFDDPDAAVVKKAIAATRAFVRLSHDVGGSGVKVKPDSFHQGVPREKTIEQIGRSLNELGRFAADFDQQIRLEVHGGCAELPTIKAIMAVADHKNVAVCWNSNAQDLKGGGLEHNLKLVRRRFGATCHVRELDSKNYPYRKLISLLAQTGYSGWICLECGSRPPDPVAAMAHQRELLAEMISL